MSDAGELVEADFIASLNACKPYTMTGSERLYALYRSVRFIIEADIPGDLVECGVWKGGSVMMMALVMKSLGVTDRTIHLFDTFAGMTAPTSLDVDLAGRPADELLAVGNKADNVVCALSPLGEVRANLERTGYPMDHFVFVEGDVAATIPARVPKQISLLRLDTDWYESTRHELTHLFPRVAERGVLIIDDYGHWAGARKAVDEYFAACERRFLMHRIDYTGRILMKS
jgi:hypothetical protein